MFGGFLQFTNEKEQEPVTGKKLVGRAMRKQKGPKCFWQKLQEPPAMDLDLEAAHGFDAEVNSLPDDLTMLNNFLDAIAHFGLAQQCTKHRAWRLKHGWHLKAIHAEWKSLPPAQAAMSRKAVLKEQHLNKKLQARLAKEQFLKEKARRAKSDFSSDN